MAITVVKGTNPIKVTGTTAASNVVTDNLVFAKFLYWYNPTTAGHLLSVKDKNGSDICQLRCETNAESQIFPLYIPINGMYIDDMDSGTVYIYTK